MHAASVEKALIRDADEVARALALSEKMLDEQIAWITLREKTDRRKKYLENVLQPYIGGGVLGAEWKKAWSTEVRTPPIITLLTGAKQASVEMQKAWLNVLRGQYAYADVEASIKNVKTGIESVSALKKAK